MYRTEREQIALFVATQEQLISHLSPISIFGVYVLQ